MKKGNTEPIKLTTSISPLKNYIGISCNANEYDDELERIESKYHPEIIYFFESIATGGIMFYIPEVTNATLGT